ncbi:MAG: hypothetical protein HYV07_19030 [Deltaproteobacteria bacterium]|nr:hypothetical protein [Deltaproteobacteria bacterium]
MLSQAVRASAEQPPKIERPVIGGTLDELVRAHARRGAPLPVAVVVSVFEDLFARAELDARPTEGRSPTLSDVRIAADGSASLGVRLREPVRDLGALLREALEAGFGEEEVPPAALPFLHLASDANPHVRPEGVTTLRALVRRSLGAPATRSEVQGALGRLNRGSIAGERLSAKHPAKALESQIKLPPSLMNDGELPSVEITFSTLPSHLADGTVKSSPTTQASVPGSILGLAARAARADVAFRDPLTPPPLPKPRLSDGIPLAPGEGEPTYLPELRRQKRNQAVAAFAGAALTVAGIVAYLGGWIG